MKKIESDLKKVMQHELIRTNRFEVIFNDVLGIETWEVQTVELPKLIDNKWGNISVTCLNCILPKSLTERLLTHKNNILSYTDSEKSFYIKSLDPTGMEINSWYVEYNDIDIDFGEKNYGEDYINIITITFSDIIKCVYSE